MKVEVKSESKSISLQYSSLVCHRSGLFVKGVTTSSSSLAREPPGTLLTYIEPRVRAFSARPAKSYTPLRDDRPATAAHPIYVKFPDLKLIQSEDREESEEDLQIENIAVAPQEKHMEEIPTGEKDGENAETPQDDEMMGGAASVCFALSSHDEVMGRPPSVCFEEENGAKSENLDYLSFVLNGAEAKDVVCIDDDGTFTVMEKD